LLLLAKVKVSLTLGKKVCDSCPSYGCSAMTSLLPLAKVKVLFC
jgi:hypothetical protein